MSKAPNNLRMSDYIKPANNLRMACNALATPGCNRAYWLEVKANAIATIAWGE